MHFTIIHLIQTWTECMSMILVKSFLSTALNKTHSRHLFQWQLKHTNYICLVSLGMSFSLVWLLWYESNFILKRVHEEVCGLMGAQHVSPLHLPWLCYVCSSNAVFSRLHPQIVDDDGQLSSSEGSTIDCLPGGEGGESVDFELEEAMEPDACFPDGEYYYNHHLH